MFRQGDKIGPYTLVRKLGRGTFGVVWLAEKRTTLAATKVALKLPNDDDIDLEAVKREASVWVEASGHPNVLPIIDADIYDEQVVIVSEFAPDGSLSDWLKEHGGRAPTQAMAVEMTLGILDGLAHLHARRIIHRDLKPANILLQGRTPRLVDFGLARVLKTTAQSSNVSGTYAYMPPEAFDGKRSEQTDVWSAGVILYQMLTGSLPYPQTDDAALIGALLTREPEPPPDDLPVSLREVLNHALQKNPSARYQSVAEMRGALCDAVHSRAPQPPAPPADAESEQPTRKFTAPPAETMIAAPPTVPSPTVKTSDAERQAHAPQITPPEKTIASVPVMEDSSLPFKAGVPARRRGLLWLGVAAFVVIIGLVIAASMGLFSRRGNSTAKQSGPELPPGTIDVSGTAHASADEIRKSVLRNVAQTGIQGANLDAISKDIKTLSWVREAVVSRVPQDSLLVQVTEREPRAIVRTTSGKFLWVDDEGVSLGAASPTDQIFIRGWDESGSDAARAVNRERVQKFLEMTHDWETRGLSRRVSEVNLNDLNDVHVQLAGDDAQIEVQLGREDFGNRLKFALDELDKERNTPIGPYILHINVAQGIEKGKHVTIGVSQDAPNLSANSNSSGPDVDITNVNTRDTAKPAAESRKAKEKPAPATKEESRPRKVG